MLEPSTAAEAVRKVAAPGVQSAASAPARKGWGIRRKAGWAEFIVDIWITNLHWVEFGLYKHSRNQAKSRQFTSDMDIFSEVIEHGERTRLLGYRNDLWRKNVGMDRRLVLKLFNETLNWRASMDLMIGRSLQLTLGARGLPVTALTSFKHLHCFLCTPLIRRDGASQTFAGVRVRGSKNRVLDNLIIAGAGVDAPAQPVSDEGSGNSIR